MTVRAAARAILFDLDGTLVDSRRDIALCCNFALAGVGRAPLPEAQIALFVGDGARLLLARALGVEQNDEVVARALGLFEQRYATHGAQNTTWMPGAREALASLSDRPLGLVTNKPRAATLSVLDALGARALFASIVAGGDGPLKPDPRAVLSALAPLEPKVAPASAWVVGDGPQDIGAGRAAGCWTVGVRGGIASEHTLRAAEPDVVIDSLHALAAIVRQADDAA